MSDQLPGLQNEEITLLSSDLHREQSLRIRYTPVSSKYIQVWQRARLKIKSNFFLHKLLDGHSYLAKCDSSIPLNLPRGIFHPDSKFKLFWNVLISFALLYTAIVTPFVMAFYESSTFDQWEVIDLVLDLVYFLDVIINCCSAYYDMNGSLVTNRKAIIISYAKSWMLVDILSCVPFSFIGIMTESKSNQTNKFIRFVRLPRLYKLFRMSRLLKLLNNSSKSEVFIKMQEFLSIKQSATRFCTSIATIIIAVHIIACIWYYVSKLDDFNPDTWVVRGTYMDSDISTLYITCLYWAFTTLSTVGYGDISGYTIAEKVICISWMLVGLYFLGFTIGSLSSMSASIDTKEKGLSRKLAAIDEFITDTKLDRVLAHKLRHAIKYSSKITGFSWTDKQNIFNELPKSLKSDVCKAMHHGAAKHISFFVDKDSSIVSSIIPFLIPLGVLKDDIIYKQSDPADEIYFLVRGTVEYVFLSNFNIMTSSYSEKITISTINKSDYFGDIEVIFQIPRKYSAEARRNCEILSMKRFVLSNLKKEYFPIWDEMRNLAIERDRRNLTTQAKKIKNTRKFIRKTLMLSEVKKQNPSLNDLAEQITYLYEVAEGFHKKFEKIQKYVETKAKVPASMSDDEH